MDRRFLRNEDYFRVIEKSLLDQMIYGKNEKILQAEESAEASMVDYLTENFQIEEALNVGKKIADYDRAITFPPGVFIYKDGGIYEVIQAISGFKSPMLNPYSVELTEFSSEEYEKAARYSQFETYKPGQRYIYNGVYYECVIAHGYKLGNIRIPGVDCWSKVVYSDWTPDNYSLWAVVKFNGEFYTLMDMEGFDMLSNPLVSDNWGKIADYDKTYNQYEFSDHEYVVYDGAVFYPISNVNSDIPEEGVNLFPNDPRNINVKKHMIRIAMYELSKLVAPNNVPVVRVNDYNESMQWLKDVGKLKINPQIPRKIDIDGKEVVDWAIGSFQASYDPYQNPWHI